MFKIPPLFLNIREGRKTHTHTHTRWRKGGPNTNANNGYGWENLEEVMVMAWVGGHAWWELMVA